MMAQWPLFQNRYIEFDDFFLYVVVKSRIAHNLQSSPNTHKGHGTTAGRLIVSS